MCRIVIIILILSSELIFAQFKKEYSCSLNGTNTKEDVSFYYNKCNKHLIQKNISVPINNSNLKLELTEIIDNNKSYGPFKTKFLTNYIDKSERIPVFIQENKYNLFINDTIYTKYDSIGIVGILNKESFLFSYKINENFYANINGNIYGPYDIIDSAGLDKSNNFFIIYSNFDSSGYRYRKLLINGDIFSYSKENLRFGFGSKGNYWIKIFGLPQGEFLVINNREYGFYDSVNPPLYINNSGFVFEFKKDGRSYVNINGNIEGPYDLVHLNDYSYSFGGGNKIKEYYDQSYMPTYFYYVGDSVFFRIKEEDIAIPDIIEHDCFLQSGNVFETDNYGNYIFKYISDNKWFVNTNGLIQGPFDGISMIGLNNQKFYYFFKLKEKWFFKFNNNQFGPYDEIANFDISEKGIFAFTYKVYKHFLFFKISDNWYINYNGNEINNFDHLVDCFELRRINLSRPLPSLSIPYLNTSLSSTLYSTPPYFLDENGKISYCYKKDKLYYAQINNLTLGPFGDIWKVSFPTDNQFSFVCERNDSNFINFSGKNYFIGNYDKYFLNEKFSYHNGFMFELLDSNEIILNINGYQFRDSLNPYYFDNKIFDYRIIDNKQFFFIDKINNRININGQFFSIYKNEYYFIEGGKKIVWLSIEKDNVFLNEYRF